MERKCFTGMNAWKGFKEGNWSNEIDVTDFIRRNYTEYTGDESFLEGPTEATTTMWNNLMEKFKIFLFIIYTNIIYFVYN